MSTREELWNGNRESLRSVLSSGPDALLAFALRIAPRRRSATRASSPATGVARLRTQARGRRVPPVGVTWVGPTASTPLSAPPSSQARAPSARERAPPPTRPRAGRARSASARRRRRPSRRRAPTTRSPRSGAAPTPSPRGRGGSRARAARTSRCRDVTRHAVSRRRWRSATSRMIRIAVSSTESSETSITGQREPAVDRARRLELLETDLEVRVAPARSAHRADALLADLGEPLGVDRQPDDLRAVDLEQMPRQLDAPHDRDVRGLVAEVAEVDRERRLRGSRHPDEDDVRLVQAAADPVVVLAPRTRSPRSA